MATERCSDSRRTWEPTRWLGDTLRTGVIGTVAAAAMALVTATPVLGATPSCGITCVQLRGPSVSAASFSGGELHETLTFHKGGDFVAHILSNPSSHPTGGGRVHGRMVALRHHAAGKSHISFPLGTLKAGHYAVVITPQPQATTTKSKTAATWVYFTVDNNGKTNIKLIQP
jgi:hypothetical protein